VPGLSGRFEVVVERCPLCRSRNRRLLTRSNLAAHGSREPPLVHQPRPRHPPDIFECLDCRDGVQRAAEGHLAEYEETADPAYLEQRESRRRTYARELDRLERHAPGHELLDVGCHSGFFLEQARERGYRVSGIEPSRWAVEQARALGLEVFTGRSRTSRRHARTM
jgi:hypothetical protein